MYISASAPDAPPLSDTTIGCFMRLFFWMAACIMRAIWSDAPPAPAATTISTGLVGSHASAGVMATSIASAAALLVNRFILVSSVRESLRGASVRGLVYTGACRREIRERFGDAIALMRHLAQGETHLDPAERAAQHQVVEKAEVADAE